MDWKTIRTVALKRDNYTCQECGSKNNLEVHHIGYRFGGHKLEKLITLCYHCHSLKHPKNRKTYLVSIGYFKDKCKQQSIKAKIKNYEDEIEKLSKNRNGKCETYIDLSLKRIV